MQGLETDEMLKKFKEEKMNAIEAMKLMESFDDWSFYRDYEKREMAFKIGAVWAKNNPEQWKPNHQISPHPTVLSRLAGE